MDNRKFRILAQEIETENLFAGEVYIGEVLKNRIDILNCLENNEIELIEEPENNCDNLMKEFAEWCYEISLAEYRKFGTSQILEIDNKLNIFKRMKGK